MSIFLHVFSLLGLICLRAVQAERRSRVSTSRTFGPDNYADKFPREKMSPPVRINVQEARAHETMQTSNDPPGAFKERKDVEISGLQSAARENRHILSLLRIARTREVAKSNTWSRVMNQRAMLPVPTNIANAIDANLKGDADKEQIDQRGEAIENGEAFPKTESFDSSNIRGHRHRIEQRKIVK